MKIQGITKVAIHPEGVMNVCLQIVNLMLALEEKSADKQSNYDSSSGNNE